MVAVAGLAAGHSHGRTMVRSTAGALSGPRGAFVLSWLRCLVDAGVLEAPLEQVSGPEAHPEGRHGGVVLRHPLVEHQVRDHRRTDPVAAGAVEEGLAASSRSDRLGDAAERLVTHGLIRHRDDDVLEPEFAHQGRLVKPAGLLRITDVEHHLHPGRLQRAEVGRSRLTTGHEVGKYLIGVDDPVEGLEGGGHLAAPCPLGPEF